MIEKIPASKTAAASNTIGRPTGAVTAPPAQGPAESTTLASAGAQMDPQNSNPFIPVGSEISKEKLAAAANMTQLLTNQNYPSEGQDRSVSALESGIPAMQSAAETSADCAAKFGRQW